MLWAQKPYTKRFTVVRIQPRRTYEPTAHSPQQIKLTKSALSLLATILAFAFLASSCGSDSAYPIDDNDDDNGGWIIDDDDDDLDEDDDKEPPYICSILNCPGCCFNNTCQPGNTSLACGGSGRECVKCAGGQICLNEQVCGVDPNSKWKVQLTNAKISATNNGAKWDADGSPPDVVAHLACPPFGENWDWISPEREGYNVSWSSGGCTASAGQLLANGFQIRLIDADPFGSSDSITSTRTFVIDEYLLLEGEGVWKNIQALEEATIKFTRVP